MTIGKINYTNTLKSINTKNGKFVLKSAEPEKNKSFRVYNLALFKKDKLNGRDILVAKKQEKYGSYHKNPIKIIRERFDLKSGELKEQSEISRNINGSFNIFVQGDNFNMHKPMTGVGINPGINDADIRPKNGKLSPIAKRVLNLIIKSS